MDIRQESQEFFEKLDRVIESNKIQLKDYWNIDHACYRASTSEEYYSLKEEFEQQGILLVESEVNGRSIATYKLNEPLYFKKQKIQIVELPAPKKGKKTRSGFEHIEIVTDQDFQSIQKRYQNLKFDLGGLQKNFNQELEILLGDINIKFHHISLESVIRLETNGPAFNALHDSKILGLLHPFHPLVVGTFPLGLQTKTSDLDILIQGKDLIETRKLLTQECAHFENFRIREKTIDHNSSIIASFSFQGIEFEIFAQNLHPTQQAGFRHFFAEERILKEKGLDFQNQVKLLKERGEKTEPAFAQALGIDQDPYIFLSEPRFWSSSI